MFPFLTQNSTNAIDLIKKDHETVKNLFDQFEKSETLRKKKKIAADTIMELKLHAAIEEEIFYAAVRKKIEKKIMNEADEEHHVAKVLIAELEEMDGTEDHYSAKYKVLSENVRHHIHEEESHMLPKARALHIDFDALGMQILERKEELKKKGIAAFAEEKMVSQSHGKGNSSVKAAKTTKTAKPSRKLTLLKPSGLARPTKTIPKRSTKASAKRPRNNSSGVRKSLAMQKGRMAHMKKRASK